MSTRCAEIIPYFDQLKLNLIKHIHIHTVILSFLSNHHTPQIGLPRIYDGVRWGMPKPNIGPYRLYSFATT